MAVAAGLTQLGGPRRPGEPAGAARTAGTRSLVFLAVGVSFLVFGVSIAFGH